MPKKPAPPPAPELAQLRIRVPIEYHQLITAQAEKDGATLNDTVTALLATALGVHASPPDDPETTAFLQLVRAACNYSTARFGHPWHKDAESVKISMAALCAMLGDHAPGRHPEMQDAILKDIRGYMSAVADFTRTQSKG